MRKQKLLRSIVRVSIASMAQSCVFCRIVAGEIKAYRVYEDDHVIAFLDASPLFPGHCLVSPKEHVDTLMDLPSTLTVPLFDTAKRIAKAVESGLGADGSFVAINNKVSQSVPHLHVHVVPRRRKDGLKGFFWPRNPYRDEQEMEETRRKLADALQ
jgi:histidine triad (HIT) family protein